MIPIGVATAFAGYTLGLWGFCLVRGYDVSFVQLFKGRWPAGTGGTGSPAVVKPFPGMPVPKSGKCPPGYLPVNGKCDQVLQLWACSFSRG